MAPLSHSSARFVALKFCGATLFITLCMGLYEHLLRHPTGLVHIVPVTAVDRLVPLQPLFLTVYLSLWAYVTLPLALIHRLDALLRYGGQMGLICALGLLCFYLWPTAQATLNIDWEQYPTLMPLKRMDASGNACPSLHVACTLGAALWLDRALRQRRIGRGLSRLWALGIVYSTLAIKQHLLLDVMGGAVLAPLVSLPLLPFNRAEPRSC